MGKVTRGLLMIMIGIGATSPVLHAADLNSNPWDRSRSAKTPRFSLRSTRVAAV
jgi:hypothetical protein